MFYIVTHVAFDNGAITYTPDGHGLLKVAVVVMPCVPLLLLIWLETEALFNYHLYSQMMPL